MEGSQKANQGIGIYANILNVTRAFAEMSVPLSSNVAKAYGKCAPLHIVNLARAPLDAFLIGGDLVTAVESPSYLKLLPLMMIVEKIGNILHNFCSSIWIAEQMGAVGIEAISAATLPISGVALGLQSIGIGIMSWRIYEIHTSWKRVQEQIDGNKPEAAIDLLTKDPTKMLEKFRQKFFEVISADQKSKIREVFDKAQKDEDPSLRLKSLFDVLRDRHFQKKLEAGICIALMIIGIVGMALVAFSGGIAIPIAWGILALVGITTLALAITSIYKERSFNQSLLKCLD
jgi:hypothetical protein